ncbi:MAG: rRNA pseudouridine synthase [PVC group bacterium]|nr:rRNA pseudouridine synthase [PVC group bacterium]
MKQRLNKLIAHSGLCSRRKADELIIRRKVQINGVIIEAPGTLADIDQDKITVNGKSLKTEKKIYILLNKPIGYTTTTKDKHAKQTVLDLLPKLPVRIYPVGRLDKDTSGLLLLTNDGNLSYELTHPKFEVDRVYEVTVKKQLEDKVIKKLEKGGLVIEDYKINPCKIKPIYCKKETSKVRLTLREGRKRQIRKMFALFDHPVIELKRIQFGRIKLNDLKTGEWKFLKLTEII